MLVKLDAIDSTNDFLKEMVRNQSVDNFTVVSAENQTKGKGQMGAVWVSEAGKNLIMSVLVKNFLFDVKTIFSLNIVVSLAVTRSLNQLGIPELSIKWPNDIMSGSKKIGGILIENVFKSEDSISSVAGIGLNVNQTNFDLLPNASSLAVIARKNFDKDALLLEIVVHIKEIIKSWETSKAVLRKEYIDSLFKKEVPMLFQYPDGSQFTATVNGISTEGKLEIKDDQGHLMYFDIKEIQMLY